MRLGADFETNFARQPWARALRRGLLDAAIAPTTRALTRPRVVRGDVLDALEPPVIFVANHQSHLDTPLIMSVLPDAALIVIRTGRPLVPVFLDGTYEIFGKPMRRLWQERPPSLSGIRSFPPPTPARPRS
jgi:1-acyl-sn-glycerol-3-phosphate acyltransferase